MTTGPPFQSVQPPTQPGPRLQHRLKGLGDPLVVLAVLYLATYAISKVDLLGMSGTAAWANVAHTFVTIGLLIAGGLWFTLIGRNLDHLGVQGRFWWSGWGFLAWLIPIANLVLPYLYTREIWKASDPDADLRDWQRVPVPAWLTVWWIAWVLGGALSVGSVLTTFVLARIFPGDPAFFRQVYLGVSGARVIVLGVALVFFVRLLRALNTMQETKAARLAATAPPPPPSESAAPPTGTF